MDSLNFFASFLASIHMFIDYYFGTQIGNTPLISAAINGHTETVGTLFLSGASLNVSNEVSYIVIPIFHSGNPYIN